MRVGDVYEYFMSIPSHTVTVTSISHSSRSITVQHDNGSEMYHILDDFLTMYSPVGSQATVGRQYKSKTQNEGMEITSWDPTTGKYTAKVLGRVNWTRVLSPEGLAAGFDEIVDATGGDPFDPLFPSAPAMETTKKECNWHEWKRYVGFTEVYDYCVICDFKRYV